MPFGPRDVLTASLIAFAAVMFDKRTSIGLLCSAYALVSRLSHSRHSQCGTLTLSLKALFEPTPPLEDDIAVVEAITLSTSRRSLESKLFDCSLRVVHAIVTCFLDYGFDMIQNRESLRRTGVGDEPGVRRQKVSKVQACHPPRPTIPAKGLMSAYIEEVVDDEELKDQQKPDEDLSDDDAGQDLENEQENEGTAEPSSSTTVSKGKKSKKKKKGKGSKEGNDIPQAVVDHVVNEIR